MRNREGRQTQGRRTFKCGAALSRVESTICGIKDAGGTVAGDGSKRGRRTAGGRRPRPESSPGRPPTTHMVMHQRPRLPHLLHGRCVVFLCIARKAPSPQRAEMLPQQQPTILVAVPSPWRVAASIRRSDDGLFVSNLLRRTCQWDGNFCCGPPRQRNSSGPKESGLRPQPPVHTACANEL